MRLWFFFKFTLWVAATLSIYWMYIFRLFWMYIFRLLLYSLHAVFSMLLFCNLFHHSSNVGQLQFSFLTYITAKRLKYLYKYLNLFKYLNFLKHPFQKKFSKNSNIRVNHPVQSSAFEWNILANQRTETL